MAESGAASIVNVGTALLRAMLEIKRATPGILYRVFVTADWSNREND